jgi:hypothetical protein
MNNSQLQRAVLRRFSDQQAADTKVPFGKPSVTLQLQSKASASLPLASEEESCSQHLYQFLKMGGHRKRQILEKLLLDL